MISRCDVCEHEVCEVCMNGGSVETGAVCCHCESVAKLGLDQRITEETGAKSQGRSPSIHRNSRRERDLELDVRKPLDQG